MRQYDMFLLVFAFVLLYRLMFQLKKEDLKIDTYRSGGQHANTTNSANKAKALTKALKVVCAKLFEMERIGSGDRSERIRTYNFPQGRVTDHRVGITYHSIDDVMHAENLEVFIDALLLQEEMDAIATFSSSQ
ncbi:hypothetical protein S83_054096 [Arachis hypogaea]